MRKTKQVLFLLTISLLFTFSSCTGNSLEPGYLFTTEDKGQMSEVGTTRDSDDISEIGKVISEGKYYRLIYSDLEYYFYLYDENQEEVQREGPFHREPNISVRDETLVKFTMQMGTGIGTQWGYYYNAEKDVVSRIFQSIFDETDELVAFGGFIRGCDRLIVRNIFDKTVYYCEFTEFSNELAPMIDPFQTVVFINNGKQIEVTYLAGTDYQKVTEIIDLI